MGASLLFSNPSPSRPRAASLARFHCTQPAYHSSYNDNEVVGAYKQACGISLLPLRTSVRGPAPPFPSDGETDWLDEVLTMFKAQVLFREFEVKGPGDRLLVYAMLYISLCLTKLDKVKTKSDGLKAMNTLALEQFTIPGDSGFALGAFMNGPKDRSEGDSFRSYIRQVREEIGIRMCERVFPTEDGPTKWWLAFSKKKFLNMKL